MTQESLIVGNVGFAAFRTAMNNAFADLGSTSGGPGRPAGAQAGRLWIEDDINPSPPPIIWRLMLFDGSQDLEIATIDVTNDKVYPRGAVGARVVAQAGAYTVDQFDGGQLHTQSGTYTVTLPAAAMVGDGWSITLMNIGTGTITIEGNAAETINGIATYVMALQYVAVHLVCDGSNWVTATHAPRLNEGDLFGLGLSNNGTDADHDIDVAAGHCYGTGDSGEPDADIKLAAITKRIDANWAAGSAAGGLATTLTVANDTWYHVYAIIVAGAPDVGFDTSIVAATLIAQDNATHYRRIGSVLTDGSANILAFVQTDDLFLWKDPPLDVTDSLGTSSVSYTLSTPLGVKVLTSLNTYIDHTSNNIRVYVRSLDVNDEVPVNNAGPLSNLGEFHDGLTNFRGHNSIELLTNTSSQVAARGSSTTIIFRMATLGWIDTRGRLS